MTEETAGLRAPEVTWPTWRGIAWRVGVIVGVPAAVVLADYYGWLTANSSRIVFPMVFVGIVAMLSIDALRRRSRTFLYYWLALFLVGAQILQVDAEDTRETARWRIALMDACAGSDPSSEFASQCRGARVRADYEPCDFGTSAEQCRRELYRDAGWPVNEVPIPTHRYGDTLPQGNMQ